MHHTHTLALIAHCRPTFEVIVKYLNGLKAAEGEPCEVLGQWTGDVCDLEAASSDPPALPAGTWPPHQHGPAGAWPPGEHVHGPAGSPAGGLQELLGLAAQHGPSEGEGSGEKAGERERIVKRPPASLLQRAQNEGLGWAKRESWDEPPDSSALLMVRKANWSQSCTNSWQAMDLKIMLQPPQ